MGADITAVFDAMADDDDVRVTILTGAGRGFSAGAFVKDPQTHALDTVANGVMRERPHRPMFNWDYAKPLIAAVNGPAYGAGFNLVLAADLIIASTAARFCFPMSRLGIIPAWPGVQTLALYVGKARAAEMTLRARAVGGEEAATWGLANVCVAPEELMSTARAWAEELAQLGPLSLRLIKDELHDSEEPLFDRKRNRLRFMAVSESEDREEGHRAWREKRAPVFKGR
jgi:enoyl-CoA hydratase/carnithine racemase